MKRLREDIFPLVRSGLARRRRTIVTVAAGALVVAIVVGALYWFLEIRWRRPPSIFDTPVDDVMAYFARDDFNALSVEERMELIAQFVERFRGLTQSESAVLSSFMAGLTGKTREQLTQNVRILARDLLKEGAERYLSTPPDERETFLDEWLVTWIKFGERVIDGRESGRSDQERLAEVKRDASREQAQEARRRTETAFTRDRALRFLDLWRSEIEATATPQDQGRIFRFLSDLRGHVGGGGG